MASSADLYTAPSEASYLLLTPFDMPTSSGSIRAIAFSSNSGALVTAGVSVMLTVIFLCAWNFVSFIALLSSSKASRRRHAALVVLWNSNDAWFALTRMVRYAFECRNEGWELAYGLMWALVAFTVFGASIALGVVGPSLIHIGNAAPVRAEMAYYPLLTRDADVILKVFGLRAPSYLRALGSVEAADVTKRKDVMIDDERLPKWKGPNGEEPMYRLNYSYSITGTTMGLQHGSDLVLNVAGSCITEYEWYDAKASNDDYEVYRLWGSTDKKLQFVYPIDSSSIQNAPKVTFRIHPEPDSQRKDGKVRFAAVAWGAHRASISEGSSDGWYSTENGKQNYTVPYGAKNWIKRGRPALSCWQQDIWRYGSQVAKNVEDIKNLQGVKVPVALLDLLSETLSEPKLAELGNASGDSALRSRTTSPNGVIDASASSIRKDLERLLVASYVSSQSTFLDTTMMRDDNWKNILEGGRGGPRDGVGDFVIVSPGIETFSIAGLATVVVSLVVLLIIESGVTALIRLHRHPIDEKTGRPRRWVLFKALAAVALFRRIYEHPDVDPEVYMKDERWHCIAHFPDDKDKTDFDIKGCKTHRCRGHIVANSMPSSPSISQQEKIKSKPPSDTGAGQAVDPPVSRPASPLASPAADEPLLPQVEPRGSSSV